MADDAGLDAGPGIVTPFLALDEVLTDHAHAIQDALGDEFVGLYPVGSLAVGDFDLTSDVDFLVVVRSEPSAGTVDLLRSAHRSLLARDTRWVRHLEYSVFPLHTLARKSSPYGADGHDDSPERMLWYFPNGGPDLERSDHDNSLVTRWTLRYRSTAVLGPDPAAFAPEVTASELRREIRSSMLGWSEAFGPGSPFDNRFHQVFFVLNNCRALQDLHEGRVTSKREGMRWALRHLDAEWHPLIEWCWRERQDTGISVLQPADPEAVRETVRFMGATTRLAERFEVLEEG